MFLIKKQNGTGKYHPRRICAARVISSLRICAARVIFALCFFTIASCRSHQSHASFDAVEENITAHNPIQIEENIQAHDTRGPQTLHAYCACLGEHFAQAATYGAAYGAQNRLGTIGMPKNSRQTPEGYWVGSQPSPKEIDELYARNIRLVVTAASMGSETFHAIRNKLNAYHMQHVNIPFGGRFPNPKSFYEKIHGYRPNQVYIHCEHGGDRSGAILAYMLIIDHGWTIPHAFLAVAFPGKSDTRKLVELLEKRGFNVEQPDIDDYLGIYSAETNGGYGGLKVRSSGYVKLINTTIDAALRSLNQKL